MEKDMKLEAVLAENLNALMRATPDLDTNDKVAKRSGVGRGTVDRLRKAEVSTKMETVTALASAFGVQPVDLLVPRDAASAPSLPEIDRVNSEGTATHSLEWNSPDELALLNYFRRLNAADRKTGIQIIGIMAGALTSSAANEE